MNSYHIIFMEENKLEYIYLRLCVVQLEISAGMVTSVVKFNGLSRKKLTKKCVTGQTLISGLNIMSVKLLTACRCSSRRIHINTFNLFAPRMDLKV